MRLAFRIGLMVALVVAVFVTAWLVSRLARSHFVSREEEEARLLGARSVARVNVDLNEVELRPGLLADYDSGLFRIESKPAGTWGIAGPPPQVGATSLHITWTGVLELRDPGPLRLGGHVAGNVKVELNDETVLEAQSATGEALEWSDWCEHPVGEYRLRVEYRSFAESPARLQLWWEGKTFAPEPLPATHLKHVPQELPVALREYEAAERGRTLAGKLGCARCHAAAMPGIAAPPPGPSLADVGSRLRRGWLFDWLGDPAKVRPGARMPNLFTADRVGAVERALIVEHLFKSPPQPVDDPPRDHRKGREAFLGLGCTACHVPPDDKDAAPDPDRFSLHGLNDRFNRKTLAAFLLDPDQRYPDGRMPRFPLDANTASNLATFLLMWSKPASEDRAISVTDAEADVILRRLGAKNRAEAATTLLRERGCIRCHAGLSDQPAVTAVEIRQPQAGCVGEHTLPRFGLGKEDREYLKHFVAGASTEKPSPFWQRQELLIRSGCFRCHARDNERTAPLEAISRNLWSAHLARMPFQRTPALDRPLGKYTRAHLKQTLREGVSGVRPSWYSFRMPSFGNRADELVRALAEADGDDPNAADPPPSKAADPTLASLGPVLVGAQGYSCTTCHVWNGKPPDGIEPGTVGPELTSVTKRIRRDWFDRWLEGPLRIHPGTPMPAVFRHGEPAPNNSILEGKADQQKDAIWAYLSLGKDAPAPTPVPPISVPLPESGGPLVAQIPIVALDNRYIESLSVLYPTHDLLLYDLGALTLRNVYTGAEILRHATNWRSFSFAGTPIGTDFSTQPAFVLDGEKPTAHELLGFDRLPHGVKVRSRLRFGATAIELDETATIPKSERRLEQSFTVRGVPAGKTLELHTLGNRSLRFSDSATTQAAKLDLPAAQAPPPAKPLPNPVHATDDGPPGSLEQPGYRAIMYPRPKTATGEDRLMPGAMAAHPRDGRVFVASMKLGELFVLNDPHDNGKDARFDNLTDGLFQEAYGLLAEEDALYVLHRRNLTRVALPKVGQATRLDRAALIPHAIANAYDWGYGPVRDRAGNFVLTLAPYANQKMAGSGNAVRLKPTPEGGVTFEEIAFGFRNPFGWCTGPDGEIFFTDNQGDWVATNKLCHIVEGRYYGWPNPQQRHHHKKPVAKPALWVPYSWAKSLNGVTYDNTGGKFGPFAGQFFIAELMHGGAIIRGQLEKVNGEYQGACFPFWGRGLIGPLVLTFDPRGRLFVGGITQPGWMGQPDRGALFRIDYTGQVPFEIQSIHVRPRGFRLRFTAPVDAATAANAASYALEQYRYEYTGAYGSPELDRTKVAVERVEAAADGLSADLTTAPLVKDRVYMITAKGVKSAKGETLVHPTAAYTLNEIPRE
jgi:glucose/arabinose dehydrogenase/cytochrome c551/c552